MNIKGGIGGLMPKRKGQSALESAFVVLFIALAIVVIVAKATLINGHIDEMANARVLAQETTTQLSLKGTVTHLIRVDPNNSTNRANPSSLLPVKLYVLSENCGTARDQFEAAFGGANKVVVDCKKAGLYNRLVYS